MLARPGCASACEYPSVMSDHTARRDPPDHRPLASARAIGDAVERVDPFIGAQLVVVAAIALDLFLPERLTIGPSWLLPSVEGLLLVALVVVSPHPVWRTSELRRKVAITLIALVSAANVFSLVELVHFLLHHHVKDGRELIFAGVQLWLTNVLLFGLWYWEVDRGGPLRRATAPEADRPPDFMFPQDADPRMRPPEWSPGLIDYLYVSFTNASAFSPTDTMPLSRHAKVLMVAQALTSLLIVILVVSRAVGILG
jgi:uncharacterized membrane protein